MIARDDRTVLQLPQMKIANMPWCVRTDRQVQHLIEVAVVEASVPADRQGIAAHDAGGRGGIKRIGEPLHVRLVVSTLNQKLQKPADRHVRDGIEVVEFNVVLAAQLSTELQFNRVLFGGQECAHGIVDEI